MLGTPEAAPARGDQASTRISRPRLAARWRWNCSRQALVVSTARSKLALACGDLVLVHGPGGAAVAGRPVRAAQAGVGQAHEGAEHDDAPAPAARRSRPVRWKWRCGLFMAVRPWRWMPGGRNSFHQLARGPCACRRARSRRVVQHEEAARIHQVHRHRVGASPLAAARPRASHPGASAAGDGSAALPWAARRTRARRCDRPCGPG